MWVTNMLALRHEYAGHEFVGALVVLGREMSGFDGSGRAVFAVGFPCFGLLRFACFGCTSGAGVLAVG